jgi:Fe-S cluster assembly protein SufD
MATIAPVKTSAEAAIAEEFDRIGTKLPGGRAVGLARRAAMARFRDGGLPHRRIEDWKYTDLRALLKDALPLAVVDDTNVATKDLNAALGPLAALDAHRIVLINGHYRKELSKHDAIPGVDVRTLAPTLAAMPDDAAVRMLKSTAPDAETVGALNAALATDGVIVSVAPNTKLSKPLLLVHATAGGTARHVVVRNTLGILPGAELTVVEAYVTLAGAPAGQVNTSTEVGLGTGARLDHVKITLDAAAHISSIAPTLEAESTYRAFYYTADSALVRNQSYPLFAGEGSKLDVSGVMLGRAHEHCDTTLVIDHAVPACESRELFKTVLDGHARSVFQGRVIVRPAAQKTDGKQMAQALMLSDTAEFDSKPELEIYADDVVCGHGATAAELDENLMFYLRSRGIPKPQARALLIESFIGEALDKIEHEAVREALAGLAATWLSTLES